jgi:zinc/manganese transport system substrate-binding protein
MRPARALVAVALSATLVALAGCAAASGDRSSGAGPAGGDGPLVVVSTNILGDVVERIAGDEAEVVVLMQRNADPHSFEISAQDAARILDADLIVSNGLGLEEGLQQNLDAATADGVRSITAGELIDPLEYSSSSSDDADADKDDPAGAADPHFWTDPARMIEVVAGIAEALEDTPGVDGAAIIENAAVYTEELEALDAEMTAAFAAIPPERRQLVTNHHVFGYLAERYDFTVIGAVIPGGTTLAAPSASDLDELVAAIEEAGVSTIFADSSQPDRLVQVLADEASIDVDVVALFTESLGEPGQGADTYLQMMRSNTELIATGLSP